MHKLFLRFLVIVLKILPRRRRVIFENNATDLMMDIMGENKFMSALLESVEKRFKVETSKKFASAEEEVEKRLMLKDHPRLLPYKPYFTNTLRNLRVKNGLAP